MQPCKHAPSSNTAQHAASHYMHAVARNHLPSRAPLAWMMLHGRPTWNRGDSGVAQSHDTAFALLEEGDRQGCPHCRGILSYCLSQGCGVATKSEPAQYLPLARSSAAANSKYGQYVLGCHFQRHEEDHAGGFAQLQLSAAQGLDAAQFELGRCYRFGYGVAIDDKEALRLYRLAADAAFPDAFESLTELAADVDEEIY
jgi:TPR repeat protein